MKASRDNLEAALLEAETALACLAADSRWPALAGERPELREALRWTWEGLALSGEDEPELALEWVEEAASLSAYLAERLALGPALPRPR